MTASIVLRQFRFRMNDIQLSRRTVSPISGPTLRMGQCHDHYTIVHDPKDDPKRKTSQQTFAMVKIQGMKCGWIALNSVERFIDGLRKVGRRLT